MFTSTIDIERKMSDSPVTSRSRGGGSGGSGESPLVTRSRLGSNMVRPQPVTEPSFMESVAGFINEVQSFNHPGGDPKAQVTWARFEQADINDSSFYPDNQEINGNYLPLLLVLGYSQGVQVWFIPGSGEAQLVLSWSQGQVKCLRILPSPQTTPSQIDQYIHARPLVALSDSSGPGAPFMSVSFVSLSTGEQVNNIKFNCEVADIYVNKRVICVAFRERVAVFDALTLKDKFTITTCYPSPGVHPNPIALHDRWLAYADRSLNGGRRSAGGMEGEAGQSVTAWGINVGSKLASGVSKMYTNMFSTNVRPNPSASQSILQPEDGERGVVTILDTAALNSNEKINENIDVNNPKLEGVIAHFIAHNKAIVALQWDQSGSLLLTADKPGNNFHLFRIVAHPLGPAFAAVHHLYTLYRGDTPGSVQDIAFAPDSRWVSVSTLRGTTHIFPICPYGGPVGVRTHTSHRVVNKMSRFHRSAGLNENQPSSSSGRNSPNPTLGSSPGAGRNSFELPSASLGGPPLPYPSPHFPPYPVPTLIQPISQLRQPYIQTLTSQVSLTTNRKSSGVSKRNSVPDDVPIRLAVTFAPSRARVMTGVHGALYSRPIKNPTDSLYVMANHGQLLEYSLDPIPDQTIAKDKICESSPIELNIVAYGQWNLGKLEKDRTEISPPLALTNPLIITKESLVPSEGPYPDDINEDGWLSKVEIVTHIGPARRLWMGPQFSFKTFQHPGQSDEIYEMEVNVASRPQQSEPVQMPGGAMDHRGFRGQTGQMPVLIECGSASSFELSPRFANLSIRGSREHVHIDLENELKEAMTEVKSCPKEDGSGQKIKMSSHKRRDSDEEFFSLSSEDVRSTPAITEGRRSRNSSGVSLSSQPRSRHTSTSSYRTVEMVTADTKIFSVAVQEGKTELTNDLNDVILKDVESQMMEIPAILSKRTRDANEDMITKDIMSMNLDFVIKAKSCNDNLCIAMTDSIIGELESEPKEPEKLEELVKVIPEAIKEPEQPKESETDSKKSKKNKKKKNKGAASVTCSSADEMQEVEVKSKTKNRKSQEKEIVSKENISEKEAKKNITDQKENTKEKYVAKDLETPNNLSGKKEKQVVNLMDDDDEDETPTFFIRERSSSVDEEELKDRKSDPFGMKPQQATQFDNYLKESSSMIDAQISGAIQKYEYDEEDMRCSEDEGLVEIKNDKGNDDQNNPHLLEDEEEVNDNSMPIQTNVHETIEKQQSHVKDDMYSSDDDFFFRPVYKKKGKKQKQKESEDESSRNCKEGSLADSESENVTQEQKQSLEDEEVARETGWSFEDDDLDVNKLLSEVVPDGESPAAITPEETEEERTALEDVFRFDSEIAEEETDIKQPLTEETSKSLSIDDLNDALKDETDSEAEGAIPVVGRRRCESMTTDDENGSEPNKNKSLGATSMSSSYGGTTSASEGSVSNSPNPRATKSKGKKGKKKRH